MWICVYECIWFSHIFLSPSFLCFHFFLVHQLFENLVQAINDSNLQCFFFEITYNVVSMIDYSKNRWTPMSWTTPSPSKYLVPRHPLTTQGSNPKAIRSKVVLFIKLESFYALLESARSISSQTYRLISSSYNSGPINFLHVS